MMISDFKGTMDTQEFGETLFKISNNEQITLPGGYFNDFKLIKLRSTYKITGKTAYTTHIPEFEMLYFNEKGEAFIANCRIDFSDDSSERIIISKWRKAQKLINLCKRHVLILNSEKEIETILKEVNNYAYEYAEEMYYPHAVFLLAPELELLCKAGYVFADSIINKIQILRRHETGTIDQYNRLVKNGGRNIKEIFKTEKAVYSVLKNESDLKVWDNYRKMYKKGRLTPQEVKELYESNENDIDKLDEVLRKKDNNGKSYFTLKSLLNYLEKIDRYEAIDSKEGLFLLKDYLEMCKQLDIKPNLTSDSLKREHDVSARIFRNKRDEILDKKMQPPCLEASKYNYKENVFFIRAVKGYDDLVDEAKQQRNCVASYGRAIANKSTMVFFMREVNSPEKSLATVELTYTGELKQARLACNRPIHNKAQSDFLKRWRKRVLDIMQV